MALGYLLGQAEDKFGPKGEPGFGRANFAGAWRLQAGLPARHLAREAVRPVAAAATQPPSWRVPPARHLQQQIQLKFGEQITRIWFPFRASGAKRETMLWTTTLRSMSCSR